MADYSDVFILIFYKVLENINVMRETNGLPYSYSARKLQTKKWKPLLRGPSRPNGSKSRIFFIGEKLSLESDWSHVKK